MKCTKWPFRPVHITNDGEKAPKGSPLRKLTGEGIIPNAHLRGVHTSICMKLKNPTTIIEFSTEDEPVRTDSPLLSLAEAPFGWQPPCRMFREYNKELKCNECDSEHAVLFRGLNKSNLEGEVKERIKKNKYIQTYLSSDPEASIDFKKVSNRGYLEYDCPILGYIELMFPISFEDKIIAAFFMKQICIRGKLGFIDKTRMDFFRKNQDCFDKYCEENRRDPDELKKEILRVHNSWVNEEGNVLDKQQYDALKKQVGDQLEGLEGMLNEQMLLQREGYVRHKIDRRIQEFQRNLPLNLRHDEDSLSLLWENVEARMGKIVEDFAIRYVVVFGIKPKSRGDSWVLDVVAKTGDLPTDIIKGIDFLKFNLDKIPEAARQGYTTSLHDPGIIRGLEGFPVRLRRKFNIIRFFPVPFLEQGSIVMLIGYYENNPLTSIENEPGGPLDRNLESFYNIVLSVLSSVIGRDAEVRRVRALGRLTHELKVPLIAIRGAADFMIRTPHIDKFFDYDYAGDILSWSELMGRLIDNADMLRYSSEGIQIKPVRTRLLSDVVAPAIRQVRLLLEERGFSYSHIRYDDKALRKIPELWLDRNYFQQVIFNLLSNAIKYAYSDPDAFGVEIGESEDSSGFIIWFRDFGMGMEPEIKDRIFEEGTRGEIAIERNVVGQGLGLWVVRRIVERHGGRIKVTKLQFPTEFEISLPYWLTARKPL